MKTARFLAVSLLISAISSPWAPAQEGPLAIQDFHGVRYVSGGVGQDERDYLKSIEGNFNLRLMFAAQDGAYLSSVRVVIQDRGGNMVLDAVADGPFLYTALPPGSYTVTASAEDKSNRRQVTVGANRLSHIDFYWKSAEPFGPDSRSRVFRPSDR